MRFTAVLLSVLILFAAAPAQEQTPTPPPSNGSPVADQDKYDFQAAVKISDPSEREAAFIAFVETHPESELIPQAAEYITAARAEMAAKAIEAGNNEEGVRLFRLAVSETPEPVSEKLFTGVLLQIPNNLFFRDLREASFELASMIEEKVSGDAKKLLGIATFHLAVENAADSRRLARKAIELDPSLPAAYQTLGLAQRLGFDLEASEAAYTKALELDPESNVSRRSLAEIKRALGKPGEALELYNEIIAADPSDANAGTGRTLALFDAGRIEEAESSLETLLSVNPRNMVLLSGVAYWYAANGRPQKAVEFANRALAAEPRYTWSYIALARGLIAAGRPLEAERILLSALRYGNFPTLEYEIAAARLEAGFYREAAEAIGNSFSIADGKVKTRLGGRVERTSEDLIDLLSPERQAAIFQPQAADDPANAERLKRLLRFSIALDAGNSPETVAEAADLFVEGTDPMRTHRLMFAATRLLENEVALDKASELARRAVGNVEESLEVTTPAAAVLADELYASRRIALSQGSTVVVPDVPKQTLSRILRGRIEELDGWSAFKRGENEEALVHLKRAASIVPPDSAFSRSVHWKLGTVLESMGRDGEALDSYVISYKAGAANDAEKAVIRAVYERVNGSPDGFEERLSGERPRTETASLFLKEPLKSGVQPAAVREKPKDDAPARPDEAATEVSDEERPSETDPVSIDDPADRTATDLAAAEVSDEEKPLEADPVSIDESADQTATDEAASEVSDEEKPLETDPVPVDESADQGVADAAVPEETDEGKPVQPEPATAGDPVDQTRADAASGEGASESKPEDSLKAAEPASTMLPEDIARANREAMMALDLDLPLRKPAAEVPTPGEDSGQVPEPSDKSAVATSEEIPSGIPDDEARGATRPRVVPATRERVSREAVECAVVLSQDSASIVSGGSTGILVGLEGARGVFKLRARSSSPEDVTVAVDRSLAAAPGQAMFIVSSVSSRTGVFSVTFESSCGEKDLQVTVR